MCFMTVLCSALEQHLMQDLKDEASKYAKESSTSAKQYSQSAQKDALKSLRNQQSLASKKLESLKKEADSKYKDALVSLPSF